MKVFIAAIVVVSLFAAFAFADNCCGHICCTPPFVCIQGANPFCCLDVKACGTPPTSCCNSNQTCWSSDGSCKTLNCKNCDNTCKQTCGDACGGEAEIGTYSCAQAEGGHVSITCDCSKSHRYKIPLGLWIFIGVGGAVVLGLVAFCIIYKIRVRSHHHHDYQPVSN